MKWSISMKYLPPAPRPQAGALPEIIVDVITNKSCHLYLFFSLDEFKFSSLQKNSEATAIGCQKDDDAGDQPNLTRTSVSSPPQILRVKCTKCSRTFKNKSNLKIHMLTHSGVKPFRYLRSINPKETKAKRFAKHTAVLLMLTLF